MHSRRLALAVALTLSAFVSSPARAADQTVLGKTLVVKDPKVGVDPSKRSVVVLGKELTSPDTVVGDPILNGATIEIIANGASPTSQLFTLPAGASAPGLPGWKALGNPPIGYSYKDAAGLNSPVKVALIKKTGAATFIVKVTLKGANGPGPQPKITVVPPAPGTDGGMRFTITGGDTYCVAFGGAAGGTLTNAPTSGTPNKTFKIVGATSQGACPTPPAPTTTSTSSSITTTTSTSSTTTTSPPGVVLLGALVPTPGRFNYNLTVGLPGANSACNSNFAGTHACTYAELQNAEAAGDLDGLKDTNNVTVTSFWAIDPLAPPLTQCQDDVSSFLNWEYATAHTASRGQRVPLNNMAGTLGALQTNLQCNFSGSSNVGCCQ